MFRYKGKDVLPQTIGKELNVQAVLNGRVVQRGDDLTLFLSLEDVQTGNRIWGKQYNRQLTNLVALHFDHRIAAAVKVSVIHSLILGVCKLHAAHKFICANPLRGKM